MPVAAITATGASVIRLRFKPGLPGAQGIPGNIGPAGPANTLAIGTVTALAFGAPATASITGTAPSQTLNLGLPAGAQGPSGSVADGDKGDIVVSLAGSVWTVDANAIGDGKLRQSAALSVIGRSANSTGNVADIAAATDGHVLRRSGTALAFGTVDTSGLASDAVDNTKLANMAASTIKGRITGSTGDPEDLTGANVRSIIGATTVGAALILAADAATGRTAISAPAIPASSGVGTFTAIYSSPGNGYSLPGGGVWAWMYFGSGPTGELAVACNAGVSTGGSTLAAGTSGVSLTGFAWRIS